MRDLSKICAVRSSESFRSSLSSAVTGPIPILEKPAALTCSSIVVDDCNVRRRVSYPSAGDSSSATMVIHNYRREMQEQKKRAGRDGDVLLLTLGYPWWRMVGGLCTK